MGDTTIQWTDRVWNPVRGCSRISPGCTSCYAERHAGRFSAPGLPFHGFAERTKDGPRWTRRVELVQSKLHEPLSWKEPRRVFVNSMSDLFHEELSLSAIAAVFAVMYLAHQHTFQVLTKRAARMHEVLTHPDFYRLVLQHADVWRLGRPHLMQVGISDPTKHPHRNVWLGVSVEDQQRADERIPHLVQTPAAVRFLSCEPLLERVDLSRWLDEDKNGFVCDLDWVIVGGESGPGARPFNVEWARTIVRECRNAGRGDPRPFVKQLGARPVIGVEAYRDPNRPVQLDPERPHGELPNCLPVYVADRAGGDMTEWPVDIRVREFPPPPAR